MADEPDAADAREEAARSRMARLREAAVRVDTHPAVLSAVERLRKRAAGDEAALELLRAVGDAVEGAFYEHGGTIVKRLGDGVMAVFDDPCAAVDAALDAQSALARVAVAGYRPKMRAGVHHGCPRQVGG